jgi:hypothetical protein
VIALGLFIERRRGGRSRPGDPRTRRNRDRSQAEPDPG